MGTAKKILLGAFIFVTFPIWILPMAFYSIGAIFLGDI